MIGILYPKPLSESTDEKLTDKMIKEYYHYIYRHFKHKLIGNPEVNDFGFCIDIDYPSFGFKVYQNYKITFHINKHKNESNINEAIVEKKFTEITNIIEKYYPYVYKKKG